MCNDWSLRHNRKSSQSRHTHSLHIHKPRKSDIFSFRSKKTQPEKSIHERERNEDGKTGKKAKEETNTPSVKSLNNKRSDFYV